MPTTTPIELYAGAALRVVEVPSEHHVLLTAEAHDTTIVRLDALIDAYVDVSDGAARLVIETFDAGPTQRRALVCDARDAEAAAVALCARYRLPRRVVEVTERELLADPHAYDGLLVHVVGKWDVGFERNDLAGAWVETTAPRVAGVVDVVGLWTSVRNAEYGHLGASSAELHVLDVAPLGPAARWLYAYGHTIAFEHDARAETFRVRVDGRAVLANVTHTRRVTPPAPAPPHWEPLLDDVEAGWAPLGPALSSNASFRTAEIPGLKPGPRFDEIVMGWLDDASAAHRVSLEFSPAYDAVNVDWRESPKGTDTWGTPYSPPEIVEGRLVRAKRLVELGAPDKAAADIDGARAAWAKCSPSERELRRWPAAILTALREHEFPGAPAAPAPTPFEEKAGFALAVQMRSAGVVGVRVEHLGGRNVRLVGLAVDDAAVVATERAARAGGWTADVRVEVCRDGYETLLAHERFALAVERAQVDGDVGGTVRALCLFAEHALARSFVHDAAVAFARAFALELRLDPPDPALAIALRMAESVYLAHVVRYAACLRRIRQALSIAEVTYGRESSQVGDILVTLGYRLLEHPSRLAKDDDPTPILERALTILAAHPSLAARAATATRYLARAKATR